MKKIISPYNGNENYIFVSYCHKDEQRVYPLIAGLMNIGCRVWYDDGIDPGTEWPEVIARHLENCSACIAFVSEASLASHNCRKEINFALMKSRPLLIVLLDNAKLSPGMEMQLSTVQSVLAYKENTDVLASFQKFEALKSCIGELSDKKFLAFEEKEEVFLTENVSDVKDKVEVKEEKINNNFYIIRKKSGQPLFIIDTCKIGRAEGCDYPLVNKSNVSSNHAELSSENGKLYITDIGSTNGTFINEKRIIAHKKTELHCGDFFRLADEDFKVSEGAFNQVKVSVERTRNGERRIIANGEVISVGAKADMCDFCISDNSLISKKHFEIEVKENKIIISDSNSTNGTYINGRKLNNGEKIEINSIAVVKAADEFFMISAVPDEAEG